MENPIFIYSTRNMFLVCFLYTFVNHNCAFRLLGVLMCIMRFLNDSLAPVVFLNSLLYNEVVFML